jgi:PAS domain S-box-containing protein
MLAAMPLPELMKEADRAFWEGESCLRQILDNTTAVVYVKDRDGRFLFVNRHFLQVFGLEEGAVVGRRGPAIFPPAITAAHDDNDRRVLAADAALEFEETAPLDDGEHTYISNKFPLRDRTGQTYAVCGISTDITERKRTEDALRKVALGVSATTGAPVFTAIVRYLAETLGAHLVFLSTPKPTRPGVLHTLAVWCDGQPMDDMEYELAGSPCEHVVGQSFRYIASGVTTLFPTETLLIERGLDSYAGYPLFDSTGHAIGLLAVLRRGPLPEPAFTEAMLRIFAVRAAAELERLATDQARQASEASYRAIFEASEDAIFVHDFDTGAIVDVNPRACVAYGYTREELQTLNIGDLGSGRSPYTLEDAVRWIERAKTGEPVRVEWHRRNKDGSLHWDEVHIKRATLGGVERILAITREITERKEREEALRKSEDRLRAVVTTALDCIIGIDATGRVIEFNPAAEQCFGYRRNEALGQSLATLIIPERYRAAHQAGLERHQTTGYGPYLGQRVEVTAQRVDGAEFPAELAITVAQGPEGPIYIGYLRDISARCQAEEERARLEAQLRQTQKMEAIGHLTGGMAHDFNNILTTILGYTVMGLERAEQLGDSKLARYLERAQQSGQRARDLIQQMLTFSRGQGGEPRPLSLAPLIREAIQWLRVSLPSSIELRTELAADLPPALLDPVPMEQVIMNLCLNARDAMAGRGAICIALRLIDHRQAICASCRKTVAGRFLELAISDTGPGIAPDVLERMFEPFYSTKDIGKGSGMGLAVVHGIVHEYGGHILAPVTPGQGARFQVLFPPLSREQATDPVEHPTGERRGRRRLAGRVLVVDDEPAVGDFMQDLLEEWGLRVTVFNDSLASRARFLQDPDAFDLAVLDHTMPRLTGLELAGALLHARPTLPVILYTGHREALSEAQAQAAGVRALVRKPVDVAELHRLIQTLLPVMATRD